MSALSHPQRTIIVLMLPLLWHLLKLNRINSITAMGQNMSRKYVLSGFNKFRKILIHQWPQFFMA